METVLTGESETLGSSPGSDTNVLCDVSFLFLFLKFIHFWLRWVLVAVRGLSLVVASGGYSSFRCAGFSLRWLLLLCVEHGL